MKKTQLIYIILLLFGAMYNSVFAQNCTVNAGGNTTICSTSFVLQGSSTGNSTGNPTWTLVSKPAGAPDPVFSNPSSYTPTVTGMTSPGAYVFRITQSCTSGGPVTSEVTITAPGDVSTFTAGPDRTGISASVGVVTINNAIIPAGYTPSWTYYNIAANEFNSGQQVTTNATMTNANTASPTLTLTKKANHDVDPAYRAVLRITSTANPNCWYEDDAVVRFVPNPILVYPTVFDKCISASTVPSQQHFIDVTSTSPIFATNTANASGNPAFGTTVTLNMVSQPVGGNVGYSNITLNGRTYLTGINVLGVYKFTLTITNSNGTHTTPEITYNYNGAQPEPLSFLDPAHPNQMENYASSRSGGAVFCNRAGTTTPITFYYKVNPSDPVTVTSNVTPSGIVPAGGAPTIVLNGAGTRDRSAVLTPPAGGWRTGTYRFTVSRGNGTCSATQLFYVHISDGNRLNVSVEDQTVCYPGSGVVSATISLPAVYKGVVNPSYFQDFSAHYQLTVVSKPTGSADPNFEASSFRTITSASTVISNLNRQGEYVFRIKAIPTPGGIGQFLEAEYACSGTSLEDTFSVFVSEQVNANAGSDQSTSCTTVTTLNGNNPGAGTSGQWSLISKPAGAPNPVITDQSLFNSTVTGLLNTGLYKFRWTVTTGNCTSFDEVDVNADPGGSNSPTVNATLTNTCPVTTVNLATAHTGTIPANSTLVWFTDAAHTNPVLNSSAAGAGTYYAFYYNNSNSCYSQPSTVVTVSIINCPADVGIVKTGPATVSAGGALTYTLVVSNSGPGNAANVVVKDPAVTGFTASSVTCTPGSGGASCPASLTVAGLQGATGLIIPSLPSGASVTFTVAGNAGSTAGSFTNTATVESVNDPNPTNNTSSVPTEIQLASIALTKTGVLSTNGSTITYTFTVKNTGNVTLNPITVSDSKVVPSTITLAATSLAPGASTTGTATYTVTPADFTAGSVTNTATATGTPPSGPNVTDVSGATFEDDEPTVIAIPGADLAVTKVVDNQTPAIGSQVTFTIAAINNGPSNATGVVVNDPLPAGYTLVSGTTATGTWTSPNWTIGNLANGASATLTIVATVNATGPYANTATVSGNQPDPNPNNNTDTETPTPPASTPAIALMKTGVLSTDGNTITYSFTVRNTGNVTLNPVTVTDSKVIPNTITLAATSLAPGASTTGTATYTVSSGDRTAGSVTNTATATGTPPSGPNVTDVSGTTFEDDEPTVIPIPGADLAVTKVVDNQTPAIGSQVTFTITATNNGPSSATGVVVNDPLPAGYTLVSGTTATGTWTSPNWTIGNLANGASASLTVVATVNATGPYANTATIDGNEPDPNPGNNTDTETITPPAEEPGIALVKEGVLSADGNTITYTFTVTNTGNVTLTDVKVIDPKLTPPNVPLVKTTLTPGESTTGTAVYTLTEADKKAGIVINTAVATGTTPSGCKVVDISGTDIDNDTPTVVILPCKPDLNPAISVMPSNGISGERDMVVVLDIKEVAGCATIPGQEIRVSVAKVSDFTFSWGSYSTATSIPEASVTGLENSQWTFSETGTAWVWVYNGSGFSPNEISNIGFKGVWNAGASSGKLDFTVTIRNGSGGETNTLNNVDYETVTYDVAQ